MTTQDIQEAFDELLMEMRQTRHMKFADKLEKIRSALSDQELNADTVSQIIERLDGDMRAAFDYGLRCGQKATEKISPTVTAKAVNVDLLDVRKAVLNHVEDESVKRVGSQCTLCFSYRKMMCEAITRAEQKGGE